MKAHTMEEAPKHASLSKKRRWGLSLFGLPFFAVGCVMAFLCARMIVQHYAALGWAETPAEIVSVKMESDETDRVVCSYVYTFEGREYRGNRVGLIGGSDNIGKWQRASYERLKQAFDRQQPVVCYVDPHKPENALLDREIRWPMVLFFVGFMVVFGGFGGLMLTVGLVGTSAGRHARRMSQQYPDEPWLWNKRWAGGVIHSKASHKAAGMWAGAIFWNGITIPVSAAIWSELSHGPLTLLWLFVIVFPLVGLLLIGGAIRATLMARKFRGTRLELDTFPGVIGGHFKGDLLVGGGLSQLDEVSLTLRCIRTVASGDDTHRHTLWEDSRTVHPPSTTFGHAGVVLPVDFQIPYSCEPYDDSLQERPVTWELHARAEIPGVDLDLTFDVPVFRTESSDPSLGESSEMNRLEREMLEHDESPAPSKVREEQDASGYPSLVSSAWPGVGLAAVFLGAAVLCSGVAVFSAMQVAQHEWFMLVFLIVFGLVSLLLWLILFSLIGSTHVSFEPGLVRVARRLGPIILRKEVPTAEIVTISQSQSASSGNRRWYAVKAETCGGRKVQLAGMIPGQTAAKWFARRVEKLAGIKRVSQAPRRTR
ncbi:MAG TPA: DUF3592 domain-containing protein [Phycisphaerae bacterium]|nr:DUF3592 domain-containing protein [Phycisphaerae bacterium]HRY67739.1 DUF3592 domain-containing protein [Phycisphaerae bacterium]HSA25191.1 DUF3592 domain-containing protein [Phycisphaerae bacterium]